MFYSLTGKLVYMEPGMVAVECGGVAFHCSTSMNTQKNMPRIGETTTVYTHLNVREDALDLFGFATKNEMHCFKMLTGISGVGPKVALAILSEMTPESVAMCAASGDSKSFTRANGVGQCAVPASDQHRSHPETAKALHVRTVLVRSWHSALCWNSKIR